jgi:hypothetical protein
MDAREWKELAEFLFARAMEHDAPKLPFRLACKYLISARVEHLLTDRLPAELDGLWWSILCWAGPGSPGWLRGRRRPARRRSSRNGRS